MANTLVLQDINENGIPLTEKYYVFRQIKQVKPCVGCFGCWTKTPGKCVFIDKDSEFATLMPYMEEIIIISQIVFGGLSPNIKAVLDRSIGFILPYFRYVDGEMHHKLRYNQTPSLKYILYGEHITEHEKDTATKLLKANAVNFGAKAYEVIFVGSPQEAIEVLI